MPDASFLTWPFFERASSRARPAARSRGPPTRSPASTITPRRGVPDAGGRARPRRLARGHSAAAGAARCALSTCAPSRCRARRSPATTGWRISPSPCRASAPDRFRCSVRSSSGGVGLAHARRHGHRRLCADRGRLRIGRRGHHHHGPPRRRRLGARRREDLDLERRHRRRLRGLRAHRRGARREGPERVHRARRRRQA